MVAKTRRPLFIRWRKTKIALKILLALILAFVLVRYVVLRVQANSLARRYEAAPTEELETKLVAMLERHAFSRKRGDEVLGLLLTPEISIREEIPLRFKPMAMARAQIPVFYRHLVVEQHETVSSEGAVKVGNTRRWGCIPPGQGPQLQNLSLSQDWQRERIPLWPEPKEPGDYKLVKALNVKLIPGKRSLEWHKPTRSAKFPWNHISRPVFTYSRDPNGKPAYTSRIEIPITFHVVERDAPINIRLVANDALDASMANALHCGTVNQNMMAVSWGSLPENAALSVFVRIGDEMKVLSDSLPSRPESVYEPVLSRRGDTGFRQFHVPLPDDEIRSEALTATIGLRADADLAFYDPAIDTIWDGTIEFTYAARRPEDGVWGYP